MSYFFFFIKNLKFSSDSKMQACKLASLQVESYESIGLRRESLVSLHIVSSPQMKQSKTNRVKKN